MTKREMFGIADYSGHTINSLNIGAIVQRRPEPKYGYVCSVCGSRGFATQSGIRSGAARCTSSTCGKEQLTETLSDTPRKARAREEQRRRAEQEEQETRQAAELAKTEE